LSLERKCHFGTNPARHLEFIIIFIILDIGLINA